MKRPPVKDISTFRRTKICRGNLRQFKTCDRKSPNFKIFEGLKFPKIIQDNLSLFKDAPEPCIQRERENMGGRKREKERLLIPSLCPNFSVIFVIEINKKAKIGLQSIFA